MNKILRNLCAALSLVIILITARYVSRATRLEDNGTVRIQRGLMGTVWNIEVVDHGNDLAATHAIDSAYSELERIDRLMSEWKPESPVSQINAAAGDHPVEVSAELRDLIQRSIAYSKECEGTFDITWHGMAGIWHFDDRFVVPTQAAIEAKRRLVDYRRIQINGNKVFLPDKGMSIGLGGIAKGYAIDRAADVLAKAGFTDYFVDGGGDIRVSGTRNGTPWTLGIQDPRKDHGNVIGSVHTTSGAVVSSGDYERFRIVNGVRYHHIIDPRTGWPATGAASVTVIAPTAERAVVLGKGVFILGAERGMELARHEGIEALLIDTNGKRYETPGFARIFEAQ